jgi:hypothetical protein
MGALAPEVLKIEFSRSLFIRAAKLLKMRSRFSA